MCMILLIVFSLCGLLICDYIVVDSLLQLSPPQRQISPAGDIKRTLSDSTAASLNHVDGYAGNQQVIETNSPPDSRIRHPDTATE